MTNWQLSKQASRDLEKIIRYSVENWGLAQGKKYDALLIAAIEALSVDPKMGNNIDSIFDHALKWHV